MGINLSGADVGVSKHLLHSPQVAARLQQVRGERVPQYMRMNVDVYTLPHSVIFKALGNRPPADVFSVSGQEQSRCSRPYQALALFYPFAHRLYALLPTGTIRVFPPFPVTRAVPSDKLKSSGFMSASSANRGSRGIAQLEHGFVSERHWVVARG